MEWTAENFYPILSTPLPTHPIIIPSLNSDGQLLYTSQNFALLIHVGGYPNVHNLKGIVTDRFKSIRYINPKSQLKQILGGY